MLELIHNIDQLENLFSNKQHFNSYDIRNISANELDSLTMSLFQRGEISLDERLAFTPNYNITQHSKELIKGSDKHYFSCLWESPNCKRDMLDFFRQTLSNQFDNKEDSSTINFTRSAISLLEYLDEQLPMDNLFSTDYSE